jgi:hypothetical protein
MKILSILWILFFSIPAHAFVEETIQVKAKIDGFDPTKLTAIIARKSCTILKSKILNPSEYSMGRVYLVRMLTKDYNTLPCRKISKNRSTPSKKPAHAEISGNLVPSQKSKMR